MILHCPTRAMRWNAIASSFRAPIVALGLSATNVYVLEMAFPAAAVSRPPVPGMTKAFSCDDAVCGFGTDMLSVRLSIDFATPVFNTAESEESSVTSGRRDLRSEHRHQHGMQEEKMPASRWRKSAISRRAGYPSSSHEGDDCHLAPMSAAATHSLMRCYFACSSAAG